MATLEKMVKLKDFHLSRLESLNTKIAERLEIGSVDYWFNAALNACAPYYTATGSAIKGKSQKRELVIQRQIMMTLVYRYSKKIQKEIGILFSRDRSIVVHSYQTIDNLCEFDKTFRERFIKIESKFKTLI
jgi:chromosomal replication initiation ATPase DnaA